MITLKNLKIDERIHKKIKVGAAQSGVPLGIYAEALITIGLSHQSAMKREIKNRLEINSQNGMSESGSA